MNSPVVIRSEEDLDELLSRPGAALREAIRQLHSPLVVLGASGKMGPSLCWLAKRAADAVNHSLRIIAVSRFSDAKNRAWLESRGIETIACDLLRRDSIDNLPDAENLVYLVGLKFGTSENPSLTWATNTLVPSRVAERYPHSRLVALSTGNVYPFVPPASGGATEDQPARPVGEYASAALARERILDYYSRAQETQVAILRLNYAVELRYGVLVEIAQKVWKQEPIAVDTSHFNCIWQADANDMILRSFALASAPSSVFNLTGPDTLSVRELAERFGQRMHRQPSFSGVEAPTALLSNSSRLCARLGAPPTPLEDILQWTADWISREGRTLGKPTHFEVRSGEY